MACLLKAEQMELCRASARLTQVVRLLFEADVRLKVQQKTHISSGEVIEMLISGLIIISFFITVQQINRLIVNIRCGLCHVLIMLCASSIIWTRSLQLSACHTSILDAAIVKSRGRQAICCCHQASRRLLRRLCQRAFAAQWLLAGPLRSQVPQQHVCII